MKLKPDQKNCFFSGFRRGMKQFGSTISVLVNSILLLLAYLFGIGLPALVAKITGKHFLELRLNKEAKSYWSDLNLKRRPIKEYYRLF